MCKYTIYRFSCQCERTGGIERCPNATDIAAECFDPKKNHHTWHEPCMRCNLQRLREDLSRLDKYVADQEQKMRNAYTVTWEDQRQLEGRKMKRDEKRELVDHLAGEIEYALKMDRDV